MKIYLIFIIIAASILLFGCFSFDKKAENEEKEGDGGDSDSGFDWSPTNGEDASGGDSGNGGSDDGGEAANTDNDNNSDMGDDDDDDDDNDDDVCAPNCAGKECGGDWCGGSCGDCRADESCEAGRCVHPGFNLPDTGQSRCFSESAPIECPKSEGGLYYGQDANHLGAAINLDVSGDLLIEKSSGVMFYNKSDGKNRSWVEAFNYCNDLSVESYDDWRIPNLIEALAIVDFSRFNPAFDDSKVKIGKEYSYWLSTLAPLAGEDAHFIMNYWGPYLEYFARDTTTSLCARGYEVKNDFAPSDTSEGVVVDKAMRLIWQKDATATLSWKDALEYCNNLAIDDYRDFRLPNIKELATLLKTDNEKSPYIDTAYFTQSEDLFWSSTTQEEYAGSNKLAWQVHFNSGRVDVQYKVQDWGVRCVADLR
ncbi:MAG: hypothetical protein Kow0090_02650 [Myxococcota bacterium]